MEEKQSVCASCSLPGEDKAVSLSLARVDWGLGWRGVRRIAVLSETRARCELTTFLAGPSAKCRTRTSLSAVTFAYAYQKAHNSLLYLLPLTISYNADVFFCKPDLILSSAARVVAAYRHPRCIPLIRRTYQKPGPHSSSQSYTCMNTEHQTLSQIRLP